ncbi:MAG: PQQ-binding-like beta-propeller repeat protein [Gammaproteobacteria bacterium]|nr:PQQ-binding-like beta-propeller repeat protein [Gammaproteobacteria bacterium]
MKLVGTPDSPFVRYVAEAGAADSGRSDRVIIRRLLAVALAVLLPSPLFATTVVVTTDAGQTLATAMVTRTVAGADDVDTSDNGYPQPGLVNKVAPQHTRFTDAAGSVTFAPLAIEGKRSFRIRKQGYADATVTADTDGTTLVVTLQALEDPKALAESKPANLWLSKLEFNWAEEPGKAREHFLLHCGFCHQQASVFMRAPRTEEQWVDVLERMEAYGAMAAADFIEDAAAGLVESYADLNRRHADLPAFEEWDEDLAAATITEWPIGDGFSQMHDFIVHPNGKVYVGDNLMDRIYAFDPVNHSYEVFKVPHDADAQRGGILGNRMGTYPKTDNYMGVHSFAISPRDGHIFLTPSMQRELVEFDPDNGRFLRHKMDDGFYPHTIRVDHKDRVWFTLALSSQVAMFDRETKAFTYYDLPTRGVKEWAALKIIRFRLGHGYVGSRPDFDWITTGFPMPYGIDVSPVDGSVWVARLYANDIAKIDPGSGDVTMIETPFDGPRRLRIDADGHVWVVAFPEGKIARYDPVVEEFSMLELPVVSETPYALNIDRKRGVVWVNGNQSDTIMSLHIESNTWRVFPMSRKRTFTRDAEIAEDGSVYTSNSHFPGWMIEGGQPTLIRIDPGRPADPVAVQGRELYEQHCDACHSLPDVKAPGVATLRQMPFTRLARSLEFGIMMQQAAHLSADERFAISKYLSSDSSTIRDQWIAARTCRLRKPVELGATGSRGWGLDSGNRRAIESGVSISPDDVDDLELKWSLAIPGATEMRSQPVAAAGVLFLGTSNGNVFAIDQDSGCIRWRFVADSSIRSSLNLDTTSDGKPILFFADDLGTVYAITADRGLLRWKTSLRWFPMSIISGSLAFHEDRLFVPISTFETALAGLDSYPCCRSHGGVAALDASNGAVIWEYHTTAAAKEHGETSAGTAVWGPSGAAVWTTPAVDAKRGLLYIGTAQNMSPPATHNSDSVVALDIESGAEQWVFQALAGDIWNVACHLGGANCPENAGPDFDFGGAITLTQDSKGRDVIVAGQKSGIVHALDPDKAGSVLWQRRLSMGTSNGGVHWGVATHDDRVWASIADPPRQREGYVPRPGVHALSLFDGEPVWSHLVERDCDFDPSAAPRVGLAAMRDAAPRNPWPDCSFYYGHSAAPVYANGVVYAGALDGKLRIFDAMSGTVLRIINTNRGYEADNGVQGHGGAIDLSGVVVDGKRLFVLSGYGMFGQMPGNVLLAYEVTP